MNPFDELADALTDKIYGSLKGTLRLQGIERDLCEALGLETLEACPKAYHVLDLGAGDARLSSRLAASGCQVTVLEPSAELMARARERFSQTDRVCFIEQTWEQVAHTLPEHDVVLVHAVLEWLTEPECLLSTLASLVRPGGWLSVAFYNKHGIVMRNLAKGNLRKVERNDFKGMRGGLTPRHAFEPEQILRALEASGLQRTVWSGLRTFYDFIPRHVRSTLNEADILRMEAQFSRLDPYRQLASYQHMVFHRPV